MVLSGPDRGLTADKTLKSAGRGVSINLRNLVRNRSTTYLPLCKKLKDRSRTLEGCVRSIVMRTTAVVVLAVVNLACGMLDTVSRSNVEVKLDLPTSERTCRV